ncbi:4-hydroxyphenylpyruvate dioxygenase [Hondaea fermentalgiana]|uniref:4-hydroxyphenylpyruvate dioxygenase n=1 Tax=Hondaea fermentalgiana TaxID=2315210 RepID=A0A2R5GMB2_9STRA|nr:4-hydroxyphenylpyruvate dioxygenase [Hondaea fermentalgiana]|eukprot:GBG32026.1 4-hydroxyphenylpyruvate dioxygenase [Hondaea fermentalgiana]
METETSAPVDAQEFGCEFHHVQMYVDSLQPMEVYKDMESVLNKLAGKGSYDPFSGGMRFLDPENALPERIEQGKEVFKTLCAKTQTCTALDADKFSPANQDVVEQLIVGLGWRVTAEYVGSETRSVLVTSQDARGVKIVVTQLLEGESAGKAQGPETYRHFASDNLRRFAKTNNGFQGIAVLAFELPEAGSIEKVRQRYEEKHPGLLIGVDRYEDRRSINGAEGVLMGSMEILEAFAYYEGNKNSPVDHGTVLRLVHREGSFASKPGFGNPQGVLPGLEDVYARFDGTSIPAYSDHWVSNVRDRHSFLATLEDVLGFTTKVDFNAGVVAAGRAQIESTVTGNNGGGSIKNACDSKEVLRDQSQVYLPINNALTEVGHVHGFLEQVGQGVQHLASRVKDLVRFIERVNNYRKITGRGLSFLNIPASYYGMLDVESDLDFVEEATVRARIAEALQAAGILSVAGIVRLDVTDEQVLQTLSFIDDVPLLNRVCGVVKKARYSNIYKLLRDHFSEETYLQIVRNKILVDIQAGDVLFQIFTCNVLQRDTSDEAPFFEFIQRVCSEKCLPDGTCAPIKPGCGGFGIRNFLSLFLSIEVSKAMLEVEAGVQAGDMARAEKARQRVDIFTKQLNESNPILTAISDAMTAEAEALEALEALGQAESKDADAAAKLRELADKHAQDKLNGNKQLQDLSKHYAELMESLE